MDTKRSISELFNKMALIKIKIKKLENEYINLESWAINNSGVNEYQHKKGKFTNSSRTVYEVTDKAALIKEMGTKQYKEYSTISKTNIIKCIGEKGFQKMFKKGHIAIANTSYFFIFRHKKV